MAAYYSTCTLFLSLVFLGILSSYTRASSHGVTKSSFPQDFIFGAGSSAYQIEGAANIDGKGPSNWDYHTHKYPEISTFDRSNGSVSVDFYHRYKDDIKLMKKIGLTSFQFSISWSRILPKGNKAGGVNQLGIDFYNNLIDELLANDIQPSVSLFHWDTPQALENNYGGFLSDNIVSDFVDYAEICFKEFGDRVKNWITMSEPNYYAIFGYALGYIVPNRCTQLKEFPSPHCLGGDSATEPYIVGHNLLLSHASAVALYRRKYQASQNGKIGIAIACSWVKPFDTKAETLQATKRYYEHFCGWFFHPVTFGEYPKIMYTMAGDRLPKFTKEQSKLLKKSYDFLGLDYFTSSYIQQDYITIPHYELDDGAKKIFWGKDGKPIGKPTPLSWIFDKPSGLENMILFLQKKYNNPIIIVTANGYGTQDKRNQTYSKDYYLMDGPRIHYVKGHIDHVYRAIKRGANVKGYFVLSFLDSFEWNAGYVTRYGLVYVDHKNKLKRQMKSSAKWYRNFLHS